MTFKLQAPPAGCVTAEDHERALVALAELLEKKARELLEGDVRIGISAGREAANVAVRARRQAAELALLRENREHADYLVREYKRMHGYDIERRPRLKRRTPIHGQ